MNDELYVIKTIGIAFLIIGALLIGLYVGGLLSKKELKALQNIFPSCQNYCNEINETGYIRYEPKDTHYKCFCYSDLKRAMEE